MVTHGNDGEFRIFATRPAYLFSIPAASFHCTRRLTFRSPSSFKRESVHHRFIETRRSTRLFILYSRTRSHPHTLSPSHSTDGQVRAVEALQHFAQHVSRRVLEHHVLAGPRVDGSLAGPQPSPHNPHPRRWSLLVRTCRSTMVGMCLGQSETSS